MSKLIDLTGRRFGRLLVLRREGSYWCDEGTHSTPTWRCLCDCGRETVTTGLNLRNGDTRSCGCLMRERVAEAHRKNGGKAT